DLTQHQQQPESQANKLDDLPETAQIQVLIALVTEPEVQLGWQDVLDGQEVAGKRTNKEHNQSTEQDIHTQTLELGIFTPVNQWHQEQAGGQETTGNPQESRLNMPGTGQRVREPLRHVYAIEHLAFNRVVRGKAAQENLDDKQGNRQEGIFFQGTLRRCQAESQNRVGSRGNRRFLFFVRKGPDPDQQANTGQQEHDTDDGPDDIGRGWMVIHQGLVWPVVGIADSSAGTLGYRGPGQPEEKAGHVLTTLQLWQGVVLHGEAFAAGLQLGRVAKQVDVILGGGIDGLGAALADLQYARRFINAVGTVLVLQFLPQSGLLTGCRLIVVHGVGLLGSQIEPGQRLAVQPVGAPVRSLVGPMPPDRTQLHAAGTLPGGLATMYLFL